MFLWKRELSLTNSLRWNHVWFNISQTLKHLKAESDKHDPPLLIPESTDSKQTHKLIN